MMVELCTTKREIRGDGGDHHQNHGLKRISGERKLTIPNTAGTSPNSAYNNTDTRYSKHN